MGSHCIKNQVAILLMTMMSSAVMAQAQYFHCEYLDRVYAKRTTGSTDRGKKGNNPRFARDAPPASGSALLKLHVKFLGRCYG